MQHGSEIADWIYTTAAGILRSTNSVLKISTSGLLFERCALIVASGTCCQLLSMDGLEIATTTLCSADKCPIALCANAPRVS